MAKVPDIKRKRIRDAESFIDTPQYPGWQKGLSMKTVQDFVKDQVRRKGYSFSGGIGGQKFPLTISGNARFLYGIAFLDRFDATVEFDVNNEKVVEEVHVGLLLFGQTDQDYYAINRPLSGSDTVTIEFTSAVAYNNQQMVLIYK